MLGYYEYDYFNGLSFKIGIDGDKLICAVDYVEDPIVYDYWGNIESFIGDW